MNKGTGQTLREQEDWATLILACKSEAPSKEECVDICVLWLLKESSDAKSALQEKAFLETLSEVFQQNEATADCDASMSTSPFLPSQLKR